MANASTAILRRDHDGDVLFEIGQRRRGPAPAGKLRLTPLDRPAGRKVSFVIVIVLHRQADLMQIVSVPR